ncbi:hypothetical protein ACFFUT_07970 [Pseudohalocynthiibacter aestuariivivens]|uniref:Transposase n=1 Tax=Pseudohalocynthiibacter aestuariivivens TaxID=1591409 RepID=A0ABV5JE51_9RHOB|nr:hypothetical protein [Pseudohalocynthiibacter aestuariivivens]MBS9718771.1 hypothetical protein [Pseudohalocynthiibacter aestuariivivens]
MTKYDPFKYFTSRDCLQNTISGRYCVLCQLHVWQIKLNWSVFSGQLDAFRTQAQSRNVSIKSEFDGLAGQSFRFTLKQAFDCKYVFVP